MAQTELAKTELAQKKTAANEPAFAATTTPAGTEANRPRGLEFSRYFTSSQVAPFDAVEWERRTAQISNDKGQVIFRQEGVEVPKGWSQTATNIVASKYFHGKMDTPAREYSVRQLIGRVVKSIVGWGERGSYFANDAARDAFRDDLAHLLVEQKMSFNSPVWFNVGVQAKPQCSACFINSVQDNMESIMNLTKTEGMLFKWGSGTGTNFSALRGSHETAFRRRNRVRAGEFHERLRRICGRNQERREDAPGRENGDPERGSSRHRGIRGQQNARGAQGAGADRAGIRQCDRRRGVQLDLFPERQSFRARNRRIHAGGGRRPRLVDAQRHRRLACGKTAGPRTACSVCRNRHGTAAIPACNTTRP